MSVSGVTVFATDLWAHGIPCAVSPSIDSLVKEVGANVDHNVHGADADQRAVSLLV